MLLPNSGEGVSGGYIKVTLFLLLYILCVCFIFMLIKGGEWGLNETFDCWTLGEGGFPT